MLEEVFLGEAHDTCEGSRSVNLEKCSGTLTKFRVRNQNFQGTLQSALSKCCRTRKYGHAVMPTSAATPTRVTEPKASDDTSQIFSAEIFHTEESAGEAVIDTGASRTVIGSDRVPGLLRAISGALRTPVKKMASAVNFRFGNSGTLQSLYALCIPRHQKGWLRVEVVQGRTPFLISNSIMKEFGVLIDPRNQVLRFLEDSRTIPLKTCRKNLLCVEITDLLEITTERVGHKHVEEVYQQEENESLVMGNTNTHKSCANIPPRVCMTTHSEVSVQNPSCIVSATAKSTEDIRAQTELPSTTLTPDRCEQSHGQSSGDEALLPDDGTIGGRGSRSPVQQDVPGRTQPPVQDASRSQESPAVGGDCDPIRQTTGSNVPGCCRERPMLCLSDSSSKGSVPMVEESAELSDCPREVPASTSGSNPTQSARGCEPTKTDTTAESFGNQGEVQQGMGGDHSDDINVIHSGQASHEQESTRGHGVPGQDQHASGTRCRTSATDPNSDCAASARTGQGDPGARRRSLKHGQELLSEAKVCGLKAQVEQFIGVIEKDLNLTT